MRKYAVPLAILVVLFMFPTIALAWSGNVNAAPNCDGVVVTASPPEYSIDSSHKWVPETIVGTGTFAWGSDTHKSGVVDITWRKYHKTGNHWTGMTGPDTTWTEHFPWSADKPTNCVPPPVPGCMDPTALNYNQAATVDDGSCQYPPPPVPGCTDPTASNYNPAATVDDKSCTYPPAPVPGCTDPTASNYNPAATVDDKSCTYPPTPVPGCTDPTASNYNPAATVDDGSCELPPPPTDMCPNIEGVQETVPDGMIVNQAGECVLPPPPDMCQVAELGNLAANDPLCVAPPPSNNSAPATGAGGKNTDSGMPLLDILGLFGLAVIATGGGIFVFKRNH
jgi:hypothetical protein